MQFFLFATTKTESISCKLTLKATQGGEKKKIQEVTASLAVAKEISMDATVLQFDQKWMWHVGITSGTKNST